MAQFGRQRCSDVIASNGCPLALSTGCGIAGNRIRVLQHGSCDNNFNTDWTASQKQNGVAPSLLDLPREIRDAIYDHVVPIDQPLNLGRLHLDFKLGTSHVHPRPRPLTRSTDWLSLLCASKQLHHEAAARLYGANNFYTQTVRSGHHAGDDVLTTFGFEDLVPLHSAYVHFMRGIELSPWPLVDPQVPRTLPYIANPGVDFTKYTPARATEAQKQSFRHRTQLATNARTTCTCFELIPLSDTDGTYTLRRPPGPQRTACKTATWEAVQRDNGPLLKRMRAGHYRYNDRRRRCGAHGLSYPELFCLLVLCVGCVACAPCVLAWTSDCCKKQRRAWKGKWEGSPQRAGVRRAWVGVKRDVVCRKEAFLDRLSEVGI